MQNKPITINVTEEQAGQRLDVIIAETLGISRSQAQKYIEANQITINGKAPKKAGDVLKEGAEIIIAPEAKPNETTSTTAKNSGTIRQNQNEKLKSTKPALVPKIITETDDYLVIDKPSGLLVHPTQAEEKNTLAAWLLKHCPSIKKVGDDPEIRPGIVHRLDKEASGLMVVAKTQKMFDVLKEQFKNRTVEKEYYALVHDKVDRDEAEINFPIARSNNNDRMAARPSSETGTGDDEKEAKTEFLAERHFVNFSLLRVKIHTGRMHQIRVHMLAYNHPLVGDPLYFQKKRKRTWDERLGRLFLHSTLLSFTDLAGERKTFNSPLPIELANFLNELA